MRGKRSCWIWRDRWVYIVLVKLWCCCEALGPGGYPCPSASIGTRGMSSQGTERDGYLDLDKTTPSKQGHARQPRRFPSG